MKGFFNEFKTFIARGNVLDLAVGVVMGSAFTSIVNSVVNDLLMPIISIFLGGISFSSFSLKIGDANITYGNFIQALINFLVIAFCLFIIVKAVNKVNFLKLDAPKKKSDEVLLLEEIRDVLKKKA